MRFIKTLILVVLAIVLIIVGFANRDVVHLTVLPSDLVSFIGWNGEVDLPLYDVIFGSIALGLLIGFLWEWMREGRIRKEAVHGRRDRAMLEAELRKLKANEGRHDDDVLALLEKPSGAR